MEKNNVVSSTDLSQKEKEKKIYQNRIEIMNNRLKNIRQKQRELSIKIKSLNAIKKNQKNYRELKEEIQKGIDETNVRKEEEIKNRQRSILNEKIVRSQSAIDIQKNLDVKRQKILDETKLNKMMTSSIVEQNKTFQINDNKCKYIKEKAKDMKSKTKREKEKKKKEEEKQVQKSQKFIEKNKEIDKLKDELNVLVEKEENLIESFKNTIVMQNKIKNEPCFALFNSKTPEKLKKIKIMKCDKTTPSSPKGGQLKGKKSEDNSENSLYFTGSYKLTYNKPKKKKSSKSVSDIETSNVSKDYNYSVNKNKFYKHKNKMEPKDSIEPGLRGLFLKEISNKKKGINSSYCKDINNYYKNQGSKGITKKVRKQKSLPKRRDTTIDYKELNAPGDTKRDKIIVNLLSKK